MNKLDKLVFFGNERLATGVSTTAPILNGLIKAGYQICAVVVNHTEAVSRHKRQLEVAVVAKNHNVPLVSSDIDAAELSAFGAKAGILAAYGKIVPASYIDSFPVGIINIHPSLLPTYRGATPIEQAILDGLDQTGVSLMSLVPKMDAGPLYDQAKLELSGHESKQQLATELAALGCKLLLKNLPAILNGSLTAKPQDEAQASYTGLIKKADGLFDLRKTAQQLEREVRAYAGFPKSKARIHNHDVIVLEARVAKSPADGRLMLKSSNGYIEILKLIAPSGRQMSGGDFLRGYAA